jgi:glycosyltransferase involved in cell wall biosynthesis
VSSRLRILLVTSRYPWPPRRGDQMRAVQQLEMLSAEHEVTLLAPAPGCGEPAPPAGAPWRVEAYARRGWPGAAAGLARAALHRLPLQTALFYQPDLGRRLRRLAPAHDLAILQLVRLAIHRQDFGATPLLVDLIDSLSLNFARRAEVDRRWLRPFLSVEARLLARAERGLIERAAGALVVSERDRQSLAGGLQPELARKVAVVPLAVPPHDLRQPTDSTRHESLVGAELVSARLEPPVHELEDPRPALMLTGNLGYFVNADAVTWWLAEVWPALRRQRPDIRVVVAGDRPPPPVRRAVKRAGVELVASPPDLRSLLAQATLALAPMRCGSGLPIKILEAWSAGVPVVASPWAAAGTSGAAGEDLRLAATPAEWVATIAELLDDPAERRRLAENGRRRLAADYSEEVVRDGLLAAIGTLPPPPTIARRAAAGAFTVQS